MNFVHYTFVMKPKTFRSSRWKCSVKNVFLKISHNSQENFSVWVSFNMQPVALFKMRLWKKCFPVNSAKILKTPILQNTFGGLLLNLLQCIKFQVRSSLHEYFKIYKKTTVNNNFPSTPFSPRMKKVKSATLYHNAEASFKKEIQNP